MSRATNRDLPATGMMDESSYEAGLTKREYAAIHILAGMDSNYRYSYAKEAVMAADLLFDELEKPNE